MMIITILLFVFIISTLIQIGYGFLFNKIKNPVAGLIKDEDLPAVSVIICAKNEANSLEQNLSSFLEQDYPTHLWEFILINDQSTDNTKNILVQFQEKYANLKVYSIGSDEPKKLLGKKNALDFGILHAKHPILLLTDADCKPASSLWLKTMASQLVTQKKEIVLGYGAYAFKNSLLNKMIRWETIHTAIQYFSWARLNQPYMGVGRNLMYAKHLYLEAKSNPKFWNIYTQTASGDDDLIINFIANKNNTTYCYEHNAQTISEPSCTFKEWMSQKQRHVSTGRLYPPKIKFLLGLYACTQGLFWLLSFILLPIAFIYFQPQFIKLILFLIIWRIALLWNLHYKWQQILKEPSLKFFSIVGDFFWHLMNLRLSFHIFFKQKNKWK